MGVESDNKNEDEYEVGIAGNIPPLNKILNEGISHVFYRIDPSTGENIAFEVVLKPGQIISELQKLIANLRALKSMKE